MCTKPIYLVLLLATIVVGCKNSTADSSAQEPDNAVETKQEPTKAKHSTASATATFTDPNISKAYTQYIEVKTSLVNSDSQRAATIANDLMTTFANIGVEEEALLAIQMLKDSKTLDGQREALSNLTPFLEVMVKDALATGEVYKQYCPMALKNKGAFWLANSQEILNPYFGDAMLRCGSVSETLSGNITAVEQDSDSK